MRNRPPWLRNSSSHNARSKKSSAKQSGKRKNPRSVSRRLGMVIVAVVLYSLFEYSTTGAVTWPQKLFNRGSESVSEYANNPDAGWRRATEAVNSIGAAREGQSPPRFDIVGRAVRVADGDTISVLDGNNKQHKIRFFGIDAPERDQPHGQDAGRALARMVEDRNVGVAVVEVDDYGRTVGTVYLDDRNINLALVQEGHAWWYRYHAPHERHLEAAEEQARANRIGLWSDDKPVPPWDWRRGRR